MSGRSSPMNGGYEAAGSEPALRLSVRKDLFPEVRLPKLAAEPLTPEQLDDDDVSCVKLETDFEQSIDEIANQKLLANGVLQMPSRPRHRKHKQHSRRDNESRANGCYPSQKRKKTSHHDLRHKKSSSNTLQPIKSGKNLYLVSSSEYQDEEDNNSDSSDDKVLSVKLPIIPPRQSGKPYSHKLSQLSTKKSKSKDSSKNRRTHAVIPCSGKPRSMLGICSSRSKKKSKKLECTATYQSQIVDTNTNIKIKIRRTSIHEKVATAPISISDLGQRKSKKKRSASPVASESSGEEYDPSRGDTSAAMSVAAPKPRNTRPTKPRKCNSSKIKGKSEKTERSRISTAQEQGPQSPWANAMPEEIVTKIFEYAVASQGTLPTLIRLGRVCKLWHSVSCQPDLWKNVDLAQYTSEKCKTDYKLVWLLENRLSKCQSLNIAQWKVCNVSWVLACVVDYCPGLIELSVAGWSRITPDQLFELIQGLPKLQRLDLSLTSETGGSGTCLSAASMARVAENFGARLTHLTLANNKFTALPQILTSVAAHCENLEVLDISGAQATSHPAAVPLEALQKGCPKMRVFRAANSQLVLANATTSQQMESVGWAHLEELSIAGEAAAERVAVGEYRLGDEALARLVRGATRLRLLDVRGLQRLTDSGLVRVPAWELQHLFLGGCNVTRQASACLDLIAEKWSHSLLELDLSWASAARALDGAVTALADSADSKLRTLNLCGSSVSLEPVKKVLFKCPHLESLNLSSCRALPRGMKRLYTGKELQDLKDSFDPEKAKTKERDTDEDEIKAKKKKDVRKTEADSKTDDSLKCSPKDNTSENIDSKEDSKEKPETSTVVFQEPKDISDVRRASVSPDSKSNEILNNKNSQRSTRNSTPKLLSPLPHLKPDSSSTPRSDPNKFLGSPVPKPDSQVLNSPDVLNDSVKSNSSWSLGQFKTTPTHKSEASPLNRLEAQSKLKQGPIIEQCSPTTSVESKTSPEAINVKQDIKNPNNWNVGNYSPMPRQDQFSSQRSPYSAQPSPAQPSPYSAQPSPYSTQPSPYSSQPSPYSAQPSPDTSQMVKGDLQKSTTGWNSGNYSPMPKHHAPFSPHPSPDPGLGVKNDNLRNNSSKTPGQYSPMSRQDRLHHSPYSPRPSVENVAYNNKKSPASLGNYSPMMRPDCHLTSPDGAQPTRNLSGRTQQDMYGRPITKTSDSLQNIIPSELPTSWSMDRYKQINNTSTSDIEALVWGASSFGSEPTPPPPRADNISASGLVNTSQSQVHSWQSLPSFDTTARRSNADITDPWTLGQFRVEPPQQIHNTFVEQNVTFESLSSHMGHPAHVLQSYLDDSFTKTSRVD